MCRPPDGTRTVPGTLQPAAQENRHESNDLSEKSHPGTPGRRGAGAHDALSAKVIAACGFEAIQISGYGLAASILGKPDVGLVRMKTSWT